MRVLISGLLVASLLALGCEDSAPATSTTAQPPPSALASGSASAAPSANAEVSAVPAGSATTPSARAADPPLPPRVSAAWSVAARSKGSLFTYELDDGLVIAPLEPRADSEVLLLQRGALRPLKGLFEGVKPKDGEAILSLRGRIEGPLALFVGWRTARVLHRASVTAKGGWSPVPDPLELASSVHGPLSFDGGNLAIAGFDNRLAVVDFPTGKPRPLSIPGEIDGQTLLLAGAEVSARGSAKEELVIVGMRWKPPAFGSGGGRPRGPLVSLRFPRGAKEPRVEPLAPSAGLGTPEVLFDMGSYDGGVALLTSGPSYFSLSDAGWSTEPVPIPGGCTGTYIFDVAPDGTLVFAPTDCLLEDHSFFLRKRSGDYVRMELPPGGENCSVHIESADRLWAVCQVGEPVEGRVFTTSKVTKVLEIAPGD